MSNRFFEFDPMSQMSLFEKLSAIGRGISSDKIVLGIIGIFCLSLAGAIMDNKYSINVGSASLGLTPEPPIKDSPAEVPTPDVSPSSDDPEC